MSANESKEEALREALLNVQRLREKEKAAHAQMETLIQGLQILNESSSVTDIFHEILGTLQRVIPFDSAAVVVENSDGYLSTVRCTDNRLKFSRATVTGVFKRCLDGRATVLASLPRIKEWPEADTQNNEKLTSALLVSLSGLDQPTLIICAGTDNSKLRRKDLDLLLTFAPLATQAVKRAGELENLSMLVNKLDYYAHYDMLTGLPNRTLFDIRLEQELSDRKSVFAVLFLDLDNFKTINDTFGHSTGDVLLSEIAFRISSVIGAKDTIARMGGDEFALIIRNENDIDALSALCNAMILRVSAPLFLSKSCIEPSASIGIVSSAQEVGSAKEIMQNADIALYDAKHKGRHCYSLFNLDMKSRLNRRFEIEKNLKVALDNQEFRLVYQPIFNSSSLDCHLVEVLIRWEVEGVSRYFPDEFIPIAEKTGIMREIGSWIFMRAVTDLLGWLESDSRHIVAINLSDIQLHDPSLSEQLLSMAAEIGVDSRQIELELSERIVATDINDTVSDNLSVLQENGFGFSFDDFGTGESSFLNLQKFPGTTLKIDKTFIDDIAHSHNQEKLVRGIVNFAHSLDLLVVAEGVETERQLHILQKMECDLIQGYLLAKPMSLDDFHSRFHQSQCVREPFETLRQAS